MNEFKDFKIAPPEATFTGTKLKVDQIIGRDIIVHDYKIEPSKYPEKGKEHYLNMQIAIGEIKYVVFTVATALMDQIQKVPKPSGFPFKAKVIKTNERLEFS